MTSFDKLFEILGYNDINIERHIVQIIYQIYNMFKRNKCAVMLERMYQMKEKLIALLDNLTLDEITYIYELVTRLFGIK